MSSRIRISTIRWPPDRNMMMEVLLIIKPVLFSTATMIEAQATTGRIDTMETEVASSASIKRLKSKRVSFRSMVTTTIKMVQMAPLRKAVKPAYSMYTSTRMGMIRGRAVTKDLPLGGSWSAGRPFMPSFLAMQSTKNHTVK